MKLCPESLALTPHRTTRRLSSKRRISASTAAITKAADAVAVRVARAKKAARMKPPTRLNPRQPDLSQRQLPKFIEARRMRANTRYRCETGARNERVENLF